MVLSDVHSLCVFVKCCYHSKIQINNSKLETFRFQEAQRLVKKKEGQKRDIKQEGTFLCRPCYTIEKNENKIFSKGQIRAFKVRKISMKAFLPNTWGLYFLNLSYRK